MKIYTLGDEVLYKKASLVPDIDKKIADLSSAMIETMYEGNGIGLAGPQVGEGLRLFVCHVPDDQARVFINPEIIGTSQEIIPYEEGCLSIPGMYAEVVRPAFLSVQAWDERGKPFTLDADGMLARVIQHEFDHLNGLLFIDHLEEKRKKRIIKLFQKKTAGV
jgi:peptide deformylase